MVSSEKSREDFGRAAKHVHLAYYSSPSANATVSGRSRLNAGITGGQAGMKSPAPVQFAGGAGSGTTENGPLIGGIVESDLFHLIESPNYLLLHSP